MYRNLPARKKLKHPFTKQVGATADMIKQFYRARISLEKMMIPPKQSIKGTGYAKEWSLMAVPEHKVVTENNKEDNECLFTKEVWQTRTITP